jgi:hypothetical protein
LKMDWKKIINHYISSCLVLITFLEWDNRVPIFIMNRKGDWNV